MSSLLDELIDKIENVEIDKTLKDLKISKEDYMKQNVYDRIELEKIARSKINFDPILFGKTVMNTIEASISEIDPQDILNQYRDEIRAGALINFIAYCSNENNLHMLSDVNNISFASVLTFASVQQAVIQSNNAKAEIAKYQEMSLKDEALSTVAVVALLDNFDKLTPHEEMTLAENYAKLSLSEQATYHEKYAEKYKAWSQEEGISEDERKTYEAASKSEKKMSRAKKKLIRFTPRGKAAVYRDVFKSYQKNPSVIPDAEQRKFFETISENLELLSDEQVIECYTQFENIGLKKHKLDLAYAHGDITDAEYLQQHNKNQPITSQVDSVPTRESVLDNVNAYVRFQNSTYEILKDSTEKRKTEYEITSGEQQDNTIMPIQGIQLGRSLLEKYIKNPNLVPNSDQKKFLQTIQENFGSLSDEEIMKRYDQFEEIGNKQMRLDLAYVHGDITDAEYLQHYSENSWTISSKDLDVQTSPTREEISEKIKRFSYFHDKAAELIENLTKKLSYKHEDISVDEKDISSVRGLLGKKTPSIQEQLEETIQGIQSGKIKDEDGQEIDFSQDDIKTALVEYKKLISKVKPEALVDENNNSIIEMLQSTFERKVQKGKIPESVGRILKELSNYSFNGQLKDILLDDKKREELLGALDKEIEIQGKIQDGEVVTVPQEEFIIDDKALTIIAQEAARTGAEAAGVSHEAGTTVGTKATATQEAGTTRGESATEGGLSAGTTPAAKAGSLNEINSFKRIKGTKIDGKEINVKKISAADKEFDKDSFEDVDKSQVNTGKGEKWGLTNVTALTVKDKGKFFRNLAIRLKSFFINKKDNTRNGMDEETAKVTALNQAMNQDKEQGNMQQDQSEEK